MIDFSSVSISTLSPVILSVLVVADSISPVDQDVVVSHIRVGADPESPIVSFLEAGITDVPEFVSKLASRMPSSFSVESDSTHISVYESTS